MTVGGDDCEDETEVSDLRESLRAWSSLASPSSSAADQPMVYFSTGKLTLDDFKIIKHICFRVSKIDNDLMTASQYWK